MVRSIDITLNGMDAPPFRHNALQRNLFVYFLFCPLTAFGGDGMPELKMHIFAEPRHDTTRTVTATLTDGSAKTMKMVVFDSAAGAKLPPSPLRKTQHTGSVMAAEEALTEYPRRHSEETDIEVSSYAELGYRNDELKWTIAGPGGTPNVLSELQWSNVHSAVLSGGTDIAFGKHWQAEGKIGYGRIADGSNQDSDYRYDNRQGEFSRSYSTTDDGMSIDLSANLVYRLTLGNRKKTPYARLTPKAGFAYHTQQLNDSKGRQTIPANTRFGFDGRNSSYEGTWFGPWAGLNGFIAFNERFSLQAGTQYHWIDYEGSGNWLLRDEFQHPKSFTHHSNGDGLVFNAVARYYLSPDWIVRLSAEYQDWQADVGGKDIVYFSDGTTTQSLLNVVTWRSYGINLGAEYVF